MDGLLSGDGDLALPKFHKAAKALLAVERVAARNWPRIGEAGEFLALVADVKQFSPQALARIWTDPTAYSWARTAYELVAELGGRTLTPPSDDRDVASRRVERHLAGFKRFVLALDVVAGRDRRFAEPLRAELPVGLPGTRLSLAGRGPVAVRGLVHGELEVEHEGRTRRLAVPRLDDEAGCAGGQATIATRGEPLESVAQGELRLVRCPAAHAGSLVLLLKPEAFHQSDIPFAADLAPLGGAYQEQHAALVSRALELIRRHAAGSFAWLERSVRVAVVKPRSVGDFNNQTHSELPGAFVLTVTADPYCFAEDVVHELHHNLLFFLEERGSFFAASELDAAVRRDAYYSPWRDDLRPLHGILHGVHVYLAVWRYWWGVHTSGELGGDRARYAIDQLVRIPLQVEVGLAQLERWGRLSALGTELLDRLRADLATARAYMQSRDDLPADPQALRCTGDGSFEPIRSARDGRALSVRGSLREHAARFDVEGQAGDLEHRF